MPWHGRSTKFPSTGCVSPAHDLTAGARKASWKPMSPLPWLVTICAEPCRKFFASTPEGEPVLMTAHRFDSTVLREYDIRGIVGQTLREADARALGRAVGTVVRRRGGSRVAVCYDGRLSSPDMEAALVDGLSACGVTALRIGMGPTPQLYFAVHHLDADGGVMVTGSHNPPDYNGFKIVIGKQAVFGEDIQAFGSLAAAGDFEAGEAAPEDHDVFEAYIERLLQDFDGPS